MILPPGFGHRRLAMRDGFQICGAYPPGQEDYTVVRGSSGYDDAMLRQIAAVARPRTDPVWAQTGRCSGHFSPPNDLPKSAAGDLSSTCHAIAIPACEMCRQEIRPS